MIARHILSEKRNPNPVLFTSPCPLRFTNPVLRCPKSARREAAPHAELPEMKNRCLSARRKEYCDERLTLSPRVAIIHPKTPEVRNYTPFQAMICVANLVTTILPLGI